MKPFTFVEPADLNGVLQGLATGGDRVCLIAGGSDLLGAMKDEVVHYSQLVSLAAIEALGRVQQEAGRLYLGALVTLAQLEHEPYLRGPYRLLAEAARSVATPEIRYQGTLGGNLCQRPRCLYYRQALTPCLKKGGEDCPALESLYQAYLSVMGGAGCYSVHASDLAPPLMALGAEVCLSGSSGNRTMPLEQFFAGPERDVCRENVLAPDEVLTSVSIPVMPPAWRGTYLKARERTAGDFALVSVAVGYALVGEVIHQARLILGGIAPIPWRSLDAESVLEGQSPSAELAARAAAAALAPAQPLPYNAFKIDIARALAVRAILAVASLPRS
ncbi:Aldehyde oxidoreductase FAD-binding subunit PaoB [Candidatus Entotheonellaceae bacterium PAL068K]